ncbi:hypothetical protein, partial [Burkholderia stabilis]
LFDRHFGTSFFNAAGGSMTWCGGGRGRAPAAHGNVRHAARHVRSASPRKMPASFAHAPPLVVRFAQRAGKRVGVMPK